MRAVLAVLLLSTQLAHADDDDPHYELLATDSYLSMPVDMVYLADNAPNHIAFIGAHAFGAKIIEHGTGIIGKINNVFLSTAGGYRGDAGYDAQGNHYEYWDTRLLTPGKEASWSFELSDELWRFRADSYWNKYFGWRFGGWSLRQLNNEDPQNQMPGPTQDLLTRYGAAYLNSSGGVEIEFLLRFVQQVQPLGRLELSFDLPVTYLCAEPFIAAGVLDSSDRGMLYAYGGVPRVSLDLAQSAGPVIVHVTGSAPTGWLVIPLERGFQLVLAAGASF